MKAIDIVAPVVMKVICKSPISVIDVGAAGGILPMWRERGFEKYCSYFGFEPNPDNFKKLPIGHATKYFQMAISDQVGQLPFYKFSTVSSLVKRKDREASFNESFETIEVAVETLAHLRESGILPRLDVVKTDTERHDYFAVKGAQDYLKNEILCVISEFEYYGKEEGSRFRDLDQLLTSSGMLLFGLQHKTGALGEISGGDLLYLKDVGWIIDSGLAFEEKREQLTKLYMICLVLGKYQYAFTIAKIGKEHSIWDSKDEEDLCEPLFSNVFLPFAIPLVKKGLPFANGFSLLAQLFSGAKWAGKAAPKPASLKDFNQLTMRSAFLPRSWSRRYREHLQKMFDRYKRLRENGMFYK